MNIMTILSAAIAAITDFDALCDIIENIGKTITFILDKQVKCGKVGPQATKANGNHLVPDCVTDAATDINGNANICAGTPKRHKILIRALGYWCIRVTDPDVKGKNKTTPPTSPTNGGQAPTTP